ncbi:hemolysin family protein [Gemmatimonas sp. UBA7669]|uniref:hemolysin family protein n=1 Tax=Gemmatimonas sp. UBA7669 TaxID=1946568 RepID=UPI0025BA537E|nr:hemolysin family protein [Gemmatimonas sp. UBA7669]
MTTEVIVIVILLVLNGVFSMSELAVMTAKRSRLEFRAEEEGDAGARAALELAAHPTAFLSTVQVGITLVGVLAGAFGGAGISEVLAAQFATISWLAPYATTLAFALVVAVITYLSLIFGELVPKNIALSNPERVASLVSRPMRAIARVGGPLVRMLTSSTNIVLRVFGLGTVSEPGVTEQDIRAMVEQATESGAVQQVEHEIVENTFRLGDRAVDSIMTPRPDIRWVDLSDDAPAVREQVAESLRERFLVCEQTLDSLIGVVQAEDLVAAAVQGQDVATAPVLRQVARAPLYVPATMPVYQLLSTLRSAQQHVAVVLDEYGGVAGLVDMEDVLEGLVGDVPLADDGEPAAWLRRADGSWEVEGSVALDEVELRLDLEVEARERAEVLTIGGFVMARLGRVPRPGDEFHWSGRTVRVLLMNGRRVERVLIDPPRL